MTTPSKAAPWECFQDDSYYDMWCVRQVDKRAWGEGFHLINGEEAEALTAMLNTRTLSEAALLEPLMVSIRMTPEDAADVAGMIGIGTSRTGLLDRFTGSAECASWDFHALLAHFTAMAEQQRGEG
jgi:hypothetical protein